MGINHFEWVYDWGNRTEHVAFNDNIENFGIISNIHHAEKIWTGNIGASRFVCSSLSVK